MYFKVHLSTSTLYYKGCTIFSRATFQQQSICWDLYFLPFPMDALKESAEEQRNGQWGQKGRKEKKLEAWIIPSVGLSLPEASSSSLCPNEINGEPIG